MSVAIEHEISHADRVVAFRCAINEVRSAAHLLIENDLFGAADEAARLLNALQSQYEMFVSPEPKPEPHALRRARRRLLNGPQRQGRRPGVKIRPGSVREARQAAGLSLAKVAGTEVTRTAVFYIEHGRCRPSMDTLQLIAERTGKPVEFFMEHE